MAIPEYDGWQHLFTYDVWNSEEQYAFVEIWKHRNGWITVNPCSGGPEAEEPFKTRSMEAAQRYAMSLTEQYVSEAEEECPCEGWGTSEECADPSLNVYGEAHGVRYNVWSYEDDRNLEPYEL